MTSHQFHFEKDRENRESKESNNERIERSDQVIVKSEEEFRAKINRLLSDQSEGVTNESKLNSRKSSFLVSVVKKCRRFRNCYEPSEVIGEAYIIGCKKIKEGGEIANPEAWMQKTIINLLRSKAQKNQRQQKKEISLDIYQGQGSNLTILDTIPSPVDPKNPFLLSEIEADREKMNFEYKRIRRALKKLSKEEREILKLRKVEEKEWDTIAPKIKFEGKPNTLRKRFSRAVKKLKEIYESS